MAGYSGKPMTEKLGLRPGFTICVDGLPSDVEVTWPAGVTVATRLPRRPVDVVWLFCPNRARLDRRLATVIEHTVVNGAVWVSWPKRSSGLQTDLDENVVRDSGLAAGVVDVKIAAVDDTWSALKFVRRLEDR